MSSRSLRSTKKHEEVLEAPVSGKEYSSPLSPITFHSSDNTPTLNYKILKPGSKLPELSTEDLRLLRRKQNKLRTTALDTIQSVSTSRNSRENALASTLIFAQYSAGTAICISPSGLVLTCSHCIAETQEEFDEFKSIWLLYYNGMAVQVKCIDWDPLRDLALLQIVAVEAESIKEWVNLQNRFKSVFCYLNLSPSEPVINSLIYCIGQPGRDDLESATTKKTAYNLIEISYGKFCGNVIGADPQDNSEIGTLKHDAWTYWGHSGGPLICKRNDVLIGLHSSWDDQTAMRHGIPIVAIRQFLEKLVEKGVPQYQKDLEAVLLRGNTSSPKFANVAIKSTTNLGEALGSRSGDRSREGSSKADAIIID
jgi:S1-C subfamily serine protease